MEKSSKEKIIKKWEDAGLLDGIKLNDPLEVVNMTLPDNLIEVNNTSGIVNDKLNWKIIDGEYNILCCDEPYCVRIIKSGWTNKYYVIDEDGEMGDFTVSYKTKEEIENEYKIKL